MSSSSQAAFLRPYLVIPKLIEQPTWGGSYIVETKGWKDRDGLAKLKIGQSYELFSGSNLSLLDDTDDPLFGGELTDRDAVQIATRAPHSRPLAELLEADAVAVLGSRLAKQRHGRLDLLLKFTQALGNSFQSHMKAGTVHPKWKPKPESWYYFEPGLLTLGVKAGTNWDTYQRALTGIASGMEDLSRQVKAGKLSYDDALDRIQDLLRLYDPWQYVNVVPTAADDLIDLSAGALHHSWEEDSDQAPLGNVLYELQSEAMDDISTFRGFDKGKMGKDGSIRQVHIKEYFEYLNRSPKFNDPASHMVQPHRLTHTADYQLDRLLDTPFYGLDKLTFVGGDGNFRDTVDAFKHIFVKAGRIRVTAGGHTVTVGRGHSALVPAAVQDFQVENLAPASEILISY